MQIFYKKEKKRDSCIGWITAFTLVFAIISMSSTNTYFNKDATPWIAEENYYFYDPTSNYEVEVSKKSAELFRVASNNNVELDEGYFFEEGIESGHRVYDTVPLMFQTDYPDIPYSHGTVATSACGASCAAMVVSYLTNEEHTPGEFGLRFNKSATSNDKRMENCLDAFDVKWKKCFNYWDMKDKVKEGHLAIILVNGNTEFTDEGHFILLTDVLDNGKLMINDPFEPNYKKGTIKKCYKDGFEDWRVIQGFIGCWIIETKFDYQTRINN